MARNKPQSQINTSVFSHLELFLQGIPLLGKGLPPRYLGRIFYCFVLALIYIGGVHQHQQRLYKLDHLTATVEEFRTTYMSYQAAYMWASKQSAMIEAAAALGLVDNICPPRQVTLAPYEE